MTAPHEAGHMKADGHGPMLRLLQMLPAEPRGRMVAMYREALATQLAQLGELLAGDDGAAAMSLAHKVAGSAAMMQDAGLSEPARAVERALRQGAPAQALRLWPLLQAQAARTLQALELAFPAG